MQVERPPSGLFEGKMLRNVNVDLRIAKHSWVAGQGAVRQLYLRGEKSDR
jgi:hypothetical protein